VAAAKWMMFMTKYLIGEVKVARSVAQTATPSSAAPATAGDGAARFA